MPLESLLGLVETLRDRIDEHGDVLRQSEALTRYALINPLLRELGWDTDDPSLVIPEYRSGSGSADYALLGNGSPVMMVEAKKLDTPLRDAVLSQGINYCLMEGTKHFTVTDGQRWEIYETHRPVPIDEKRVVAFDLKSQSPAAECLKALALWRPSVETGHIDAAQAPVVGLRDEELCSIEPTIPNTQLAHQNTDEHQWQPFSELNPQLGSAHPVEVRFPDNSVAPVAAWYSISIEVVRWLIDNGKLNEPVPGPEPGRLRVNTEPFHSDGSPIHYPLEINGWFISKHGNMITIVNRTKGIIEHVGQDPAQFKVRFS